MNIDRWIMSGVNLKGIIPRKWDLVGMVVDFALMTLLSSIWVDWLLAMGLGFLYASTVWLRGRSA